MGFDNYGSHLSVFEKIFEVFEAESVLEFGPGKYSTVFFAKRCKSVVSIEQESLEWYEKLKSEINSPNWNIIFQRNPKVIFEQFDAANKKFDLVFSDGAYQSRCLVANMAMERNTPLVVLHDAEKIWYYRWNLLDIPANYSRFDFRHQQGTRKVTTVLTNKPADIMEKWKIPEHDRILQAYSSPRQPVLQIPYALCRSSC
jgi:16S rRNA G966 N2-methylase RsmD